VRWASWIKIKKAPHYSKAEREFIAWAERYMGRKLTPAERRLWIEQAKALGEL
jgi:predicted flap endonuclease-1-like 5' DNA nuclease